MKSVRILAALAAALLLLAACASEPARTPEPPGPGGTTQSVAPDTGRQAGLAGTVTVTSREKADVASDYRHESGTAGAVNNWQGLGNVAAGMAGSPPGFKACAQAIDVLSAQLAACDPCRDAATHESITKRIEMLSELMQRQYGEWLDRVGVVVAPRIEKVIVVNNAGVGSAQGRDDPITDEKVRAGSEAMKTQTQAGMQAFEKLTSPSAEQLEAAQRQVAELEAAAKKATADAEAARAALEAVTKTLEKKPEADDVPPAGAAGSPLEPVPAPAPAPVAEGGDPK